MAPIRLKEIKIQNLEAWRFQEKTERDFSEGRGLLCSLQFSTKYCNSTTNLQRHIEREHGDVLKEVSYEPKFFQSKVTDFPTTSLVVVKKYPRES